jgi:hypothetical protein
MEVLLFWSQIRIGFLIVTATTSHICHIVVITLAKSQGLHCFVLRITGIMSPMALVRAVQKTSAYTLGKQSRAMHCMVNEVGRIPCMVPYPVGGTVGKRPSLPRSAALALPRIPCPAAPTPGLTLTAAPRLCGAQRSVRAPERSGSPSPVETPAGRPPYPPALTPWPWLVSSRALGSRHGHYW